MVGFLFSYPRSGNHMVRALLEAASGQPTRGCLGNPHDIPIRDRFPMNFDTPFERRSEQPIAQKFHWISEEISLRRDGQMADLICLIIRDPARCIVSQLSRDLEERGRINRWKRSRKMRKLEILERVVLSELENWYVLIDYYLASDLPKLVVSFEDLLSKNGLSIVNDQLLPLFGIRYRFEDEDSLRRVADFGRESQLADVKTLSETVYSDNKLVSDIVRSAFDYNEIRVRLGLPEVEMAS